MNQENIALVVDVEAFFGLTDWAQGPPPSIGWWKTRRSTRPDLYQPQRRWWNGTCWSVYCTPKHSDEHCEEAKIGQTKVEDVEWCGLNHPHPDGYPYVFDFSPRTKLHTLKRR